MSKAERLIEMMITINAKKDFTVGELAHEFSVSKRTILRDLQELEQAGFPLYSEVGAAGGYHILKERICRQLLFQKTRQKPYSSPARPCNFIVTCLLSRKPFLS